MDIDKLFEETKVKLETAVKRIAQIDEEKQMLLQELLRLDGELRVLKKLSLKEEEKDVGKKC